MACKPVRKKLGGGLAGLLSTFKGIFSRKPTVKIRSFEVIGSREKAVAIVEIPDEAENRAREFAAEIMNRNKNVKTVLRKASERRGEYRIREYEIILGNHDTEVTHREHGAIFKLDPRKVYFSSREATERQRVASQVENGETVMVMFSGISPYPVQIYKKQPDVKEIITVEVNSDAVRYATENIKLNKIPEGKIIRILGDVRDTCPRFYGKCDRVVMPLPLGAENYLDTAIKCLKREGGIIHFYSWAKEEDDFTNALKVIDEAAKALGREYEILNKRRVLPYAPRTNKICIEFKVAEKQP